MVDVHVLDRLRGLAQRRRWILGLTVGSRCRTLRVALVAAEGQGLSSRVEVAARSQAAIPPNVSDRFDRLRERRGKSPVEAALLASLLAECQASLLEDFAAQIAPVWDRILAVAVDDPGLWRRSAGLIGYVGLCDAARLAELSGHNVIDAFAARDLAQQGRGRPLACIGHWMLLHDLLKTRVLVEVGRAIRLTYLPGSRDASGARRIVRVRVEPCPNPSVEGQGVAPDWAVDSITRSITADLPPVPRIDELVLSAPRGSRADLAKRLAGRLSEVSVLDLAELKLDRSALRPASVALLGLLNLDQVPANASGITGARIPRVLGRLTPGSLGNWHRLVRELAAAKPPVVSLRSAV